MPPGRSEVFVRARRGLSHTHVGSVHAADGETALQAREISSPAARKA